jgi:hypothetical protein
MKIAEKVRQKYPVPQNPSVSEKKRLILKRLDSAREELQKIASN